jgi:hypothetical protein
MEKLIWRNTILDLELMVMFLFEFKQKSLSTMPKVVDLVVNGMVNRPYSIKAKQ